MKNVLFFLLFLPLLSSYDVLALANKGHIYLSVPTKHIKTGSEFYVDVLISNVPNVYGMQLELEYSHQTFSLVDQDHKKPGIQISHGHFFDTDKLFTLRNTVEPNAGKILYVISQVSPSKSASGDGLVARLFFKSNRASGKGQVAIKHAEFGTREGRNLRLEMGNDLILEFDQEYKLPEKPPIDLLRQYPLLLLSISICLVLIVSVAFIRRRRIKTQAF